ncbi:hypothetical protein [Arthrobacter agilis]|uniref:hypothetical protein n=1 Tax=Arthrobacter agilis TaxID=37921 RepID=UPI003B66D8A3
MERYGTSADDAIGRLVTASNDSRTAPGNVAENLTLSGQVPEMSTYASGPMKTQRDDHP